jgi:hypothetical protein
MAFPQTITGKWGWEQVTTTAKKHKFGTRMQIADTEYIYASSGEAVIAGQLMEANALLADDDDDLTVATTGAAGGTTVGVTFGASVTKNEYADGILFSNVTASTALGWRYRIKSHPAGTSNVTVTIDHEDGFITEVLAGTAKVGAFKSFYEGVLQTNTTPVGPAIGVTVSDIASGSYGWLQVKGPGVCLIQGTPAPGSGLMRSDATAGAMEILAEASATLWGALGQLGRTTAVNGEYHSVFLNIV